MPMNLHLWTHPRVKTWRGMTPLMNLRTAKLSDLQSVLARAQNTCASPKKKPSLLRFMRGARAQPQRAFALAGQSDTDKLRSRSDLVQNDRR
jgi:hypothetical protein